jgi:adenine-specific DNA-methyltransferase
MKESPSTTKLRGGYYTPTAIADFLAAWAIQSARDVVLEPSAGDGQIVEAAAKRLGELGVAEPRRRLSITAIELDEAEAKKIETRMVSLGLAKGSVSIRNEDFFEFASGNLSKEFPLFQSDSVKRFDAIIGNPPFIRYQNFPESQRETAFAIMRGAGMNPNRLTNSWLPFLIISSLMLSAKGRLAMVIPAELLQVNYAAEARRFLSDYFDRITLITFKKLVFEDIQQEVVLVLAEKRAGHSHGIRTIELDAADALPKYSHAKSIRAELKPLDHNTEKWTQYFLDRKEIELLRSIGKDATIGRVNDYMDVDVGLVTGQNDFFVITNSDVSARRLENDVSRIVARSSHLEGLEFTDEDWSRLADSDRPMFLFTPKTVNLQKVSNSSRHYIDFGETKGMHLGYKCRIRKEWFQVPSQWIPDGFMLRQVHSHPKLIVNRARAMSTDTVHRVRFTNGLKPKLAACAFINSLTFAFAEVRGRSYGGGVLTFEPSEIEGLPLPLRAAENLDFRKIDSLLRAGRVREALEINDRTLLREGHALTRADIESLRNIWDSLRNRRTSRRRP